MTKPQGKKARRLGYPRGWKWSATADPQVDKTNENALRTFGRLLIERRMEDGQQSYYMAPEDREAIKEADDEDTKEVIDELRAAGKVGEA